MKAIEYVDQCESELLDFYATMNSCAATPDLNRLYELLTDTRKRHLADFSRMKAAMMDTKSPDTDPMADCGTVCPLTPVERIRMQRHDPDGFMHVMTAEERMLGACADLVTQEMNDRERNLLHWFIADEQRHLREIEEIYEFVEAPHCYLEWGEFSNLRPL